MIVATKEINKNKARFDIRLSKEQKAFFERAARVGGYRSLTDFIILTVQEKAKEIISEKEQLIASQRDNEIFLMQLPIHQKQIRTLSTLQMNIKLF